MKNKFLIIPLLALCLLPGGATRLYADEGFADIFGDAPAAEYPGESTELADGDGFGTVHQAAVSLTGKTGLFLKSFFDDEWESEFSALPYLKLEIAPAAGDLEAMIRLNVEGEWISRGDTGTMDSPADTAVAPSDVIDELYLRYFFNGGYLEAGLMKIEWGKGDGYHVLDPINPLNQSTGIIPDINEMKDSVALLKLNIVSGLNGLAELVYIPHFEGYTIADSGRWALIDPATLPNLSSELPGGLAGSTAAFRYTNTLGPLDLGVQYYYGYKPEPGYRFVTSFTGTDPFDPVQLADPGNYRTDTTLLYTRAHLFGLEAGWAAGPFTFRAEAGYWLTEDSAGDQPELWNSSLVFLGGFDIMIPGTDLFLSVQATEVWAMNYEDRGQTDVNTGAAYEGKATTTQVIPALELPFGREKFKLRLAGVYLVEAEGWMAVPSFFWYPADNLTIALEGQFFGGGKASHFKSWEDNGSLALGLTFAF